MEEKLLFNNMEYILIRSNRKTAAIEINSNAEVIFRAPNKMTKTDIESMLLKHFDWIKSKVKLQKEQKSLIPDITPLAEKQLRKAAQSYIPDRVTYWSKIMNLTPTAVKITSAKKRFGSCNSKNSLCFSLMLMLYPKVAIDYVIVHELAHITHKNHSTDFYALVKKYYPDYKTTEAILKKTVSFPDFINKID